MAEIEEKFTLQCAKIGFFLVGEGWTPFSGTLYEPEREIFPQSRDSVTKKGGTNFIWCHFDLKELHSTFWSKYQSAEISQPQQIEQKLIITNIRVTNGPRSVWGSYSKIWYLSNSSYICDDPFLSLSHTCDLLSYSSHHLPTHALMRKAIMETGRVQRRKKREDTPRGLHKSPMTTTTQWYHMRVQG